jgi:arginyl-tRNA synthetase
MTPEELSLIIKKSLESFISSQKLEITTMPEIKIERPKSKDHGDFSSNIALMVAKPAGKNPRDVAQLLVDDLSKNSGIKKIEIEDPVFLTSHYIQQVWAN